MSSKTSSIQPKINYPTVPKVKFVKKAQLWAKTTFENGKQTIEWSMEKPK